MLSISQWRCGAGFLLALSAMACSNDSLFAPTELTGDMTHVTIRAAGVFPQTIQIRVGDRVLFLNDTSVVREMSSDPHPGHFDCPEINQSGPINPGQSKQTDAFVTPKTCTYHDDSDPLNLGLRGTIVIVE